MCEVLEQLTTDGVLHSVSASPRKHTWEVVRLLDLLNDLEAGRAPVG